MYLLRTSDAVRRLFPIPDKPEQHWWLGRRIDGLKGHLFKDAQVMIARGRAIPSRRMRWMARARSTRAL